ncbi:uncharacterized protein LOC124254797 [Haliotis rubra]|uniref:uncharacterized protein LOC124254797 n=1 Tax=Haliotis rubra TaxID=36100 RepID=UPI001EE5AFF2|nr:uncharacterized protein LOC124254797 [Haliotis rubra]
MDELRQWMSQMMLTLEGISQKSAARNEESAQKMIRALEGVGQKSAARNEESAQKMIRALEGVNQKSAARSERSAQGMIQSLEEVHQRSAARNEDNALKILWTVAEMDKKSEDMLDRVLGRMDSFGMPVMTPEGHLRGWPYDTASHSAPMEVREDMFMRDNMPFGGHRELKLEPITPIRVEDGHWGVTTTPDRDKATPLDVRPKSGAGHTNVQRYEMGNVSEMVDEKNAKRSAASTPPAGTPEPEAGLPHREMKQEQTPRKGEHGEMTGSAQNPRRQEPQPVRGREPQEERDQGPPRGRRNQGPRANDHTGPRVVTSLVSYDGKEAWAPFKLKFKKLADREGWTDEDKLFQLCFCMRGEASSFFTTCQMRDLFMSYEQMMKKFQKRFGIVEPAQAARMRFPSLKQEPGETLEAWAKRLVATSSRAYPGLPEDFVEQETITRFCMGCENRDAGNLVYNLKPASLERAMDAVRHYQHNSHLQYSRPRRELRAVTVMDTEEQPREVRASSKTEANPISNSPAVTDLARRVTLIETDLGTVQKEVKGIRSEMTQLVRSVQELTETVKKLGNMRSRSRSPSPGRLSGCFHCGDLNHVKAACPKLAGNAPTAKSVSFAMGSTEKPLNSQGTGL